MGYILFYLLKMKQFYKKLLLVISIYTIRCTTIISGAASIKDSNSLIINKSNEVFNNIKGQYDSILENNLNIDNTQVVTIANNLYNIKQRYKQYKLFCAKYKYYEDLFNVLCNDIYSSMDIQTYNDTDFNYLFYKLKIINDHDTKTIIKNIIFTKKPYDFYYNLLKQIYNNIWNTHNDLITLKSNNSRLFVERDLIERKQLLNKLCNLATTIKLCKNTIKTNKGKLNNNIFNEDEYY